MNDFAATYEPTSDEKTMATLAQVLQLVGWWIAPLIIYLIRRIRERRRERQLTRGQ